MESLTLEFLKEKTIPAGNRTLHNDTTLTWLVTREF